MRFEYSDPIDIDKDGKIVFIGKSKNETKDSAISGPKSAALQGLKASFKAEIQASKRSFEGDSHVEESIHDERRNQLPLEIMNLMFLKEENTIPQFKPKTEKADK